MNHQDNLKDNTAPISPGPSSDVVPIDSSRPDEALVCSYCRARNFANAVWSLAKSSDAPTQTTGIIKRAVSEVFTDLADDRCACRLLNPRFFSLSVEHLRAVGVGLHLAAEHCANISLTRDTHEEKDRWVEQADAYETLAKEYDVALKEKL